MRAKLVVFPVKGRNWCFSRSVDKSNVDNGPSRSPSTMKELWEKVSSGDSKEGSNVEVLIDFLSNKMNKAWLGLEKAPEGSFKSKLHGLGLLLLARVKPSEIFLKSISKDVSCVEITYPSSLSARLVRRRLRHIAQRGSIIHRNYFYGSVTLLPITAAFAVLPLPNIPFFWVSFRAYSNWRALKGSEKLLELVSDSSVIRDSPASTCDHHVPDNPKDKSHDSLENPMVLQPSEQLEKLIRLGNADDDLNVSMISDICKTFELNTIDVVKYRDTMISLHISRRVVLCGYVDRARISKSIFPGLWIKLSECKAYQKLSAFRSMPSAHQRTSHRRAKNFQVLVQSP